MKTVKSQEAKRQADTNFGIVNRYLNKLAKVQKADGSAGTTSTDQPKIDKRISRENATNLLKKRRFEVLRHGPLIIKFTDGEPDLNTGDVKLKETGKNAKEAVDDPSLGNDSNQVGNKKNRPWSRGHAADVAAGEENNGEKRTISFKQTLEGEAEAAAVVQSSLL